MSLFSTLGEKPWIKEPEASASLSDVAVVDSLAAARVALRFVLAIVGVLFFLFIITFLSRSQYPDWVSLAGAPWQPFSDASRLWLNTLILAGASIALHTGILALRRGRDRQASVAIGAAAFLTCGFLLAQYTLWLQLQAMGFYPGDNVANSYFYLLTAVHGVHLVGGLLVMAGVLLQSRATESGGNLAGLLSLCATYWHFLLGVWLVLFALLASPPETISALAALCGF